MATKRIAGITLEFGADMSGVDKAFSAAEKQTRTLQNELRAVDKALKLDPTNVDLLAQRQEILGKSVDGTRAKLQALQQVQGQMAAANAANADWEKAYEPIRAEIEKTTAALNQLARKQADMEQSFSSGQISNEEYQAFQKQLADLETQSKSLHAEKKKLDAQFSDGHISDADYRKFQRELSKTEKELGELEQSSKTAKASVQKLGAQMAETGDKIGSAGEKLKGVSTAAAAITAAAVATVESTQDLRMDLGKLNTNAERAGVSLGTTEAAMKSLSAVSNEADSNVEAISNILAAGIGDNQMQKAIENLSGAVIKFPDTIKIESLADGLQETLATGQATGQFAEVIDRLGIGVDWFNKSLSQCYDYSDRVDLALATLAGAGMEDIYNAYLQNNDEAVKYSQSQYELQTAMADLGAAIQPLVTEGLQLLVQMISSAAQWIGNLSDGTKRAIGIIAIVVSVIAPLLLAVSSVFKTISNISNGLSGLSAIADLFSSGAGNKAYLTFAKWALIITAVVAAVALLVAGINVLIGRGDEMNRTMSGMGNMMSGGTKIPGYATGTSNHPGGLALVGEQGAELVSLPRGSRVYTNRESRQLLGDTQAAPSGDTYQIYVNVDHLDDVQQLIFMAKEARRMERMGKVKS